MESQYSHPLTQGIDLRQPWTAAGEQHHRGNSSGHSTRIEDAGQTARLLAPVLEMDEDQLYELLTMNQLHLPETQGRTGSSPGRARLELPGIVFATEGKLLPLGSLASQVLGFVGMDQGWAGLEIQYEEYLKAGKGGCFSLPIIKAAHASRG